MERHRVLDGLVLAGGAAYVAAGLVLGFVLWPRVEATLASSPAAFAPSDFGRMIGLGRGLLTGLGTLTLVLILVALVRDGGIGGRRGRLRLLAMVAILGAGLMSVLALDPLPDAILAAVQSGAASLPGLIAPWERYRLLNLTVGGVVLGALVLAHRAPVVVSQSAAELSAHHRILLLLLATATLFAGYDRFILALALPYIAKDLGVVADVGAKAAAEGALGWALSAARSGALLAIPLCLMAAPAGGGSCW